jgi:endo-1,4-beta-xylanase
MNTEEILQIIKNDPGQAVAAEYLSLWNDEEQELIDQNIKAHRMADASGIFPEIPEGASVRVEQVRHEFVFGAHLFNFDQLGSEERNDRYKSLYGELFNSATIPFYWKAFEPEEGQTRFERKHEDTAGFWNAVKEPERQPHWRRPATDPLVDFCEKKGIRCHGHVLVWGSACWHAPEWLFAKIPACYREAASASIDPRIAPVIPALEELSASEIETLLPSYTREIHVAMARRIAEIALRYKERIQSWDVVNESATDFGLGVLVPGEGVSKSWYGIMPGDYPYKAFKIAEAFLPPCARLNINDYNLGEEYLAEIIDLKARGCRLDTVGAQMHLLEPKSSLDIAEGRTSNQSPKHVRATLERLARANLPIHMSEITISAPGVGKRNELIQAILARNLFRLWFSIQPIMGITWWNVVDGCGAPGEPSLSGLFTRDLNPKAAYYALDDLIRNEWTTQLVTCAGKGGSVRFCGFLGDYRFTWTDEKGGSGSLSCKLNQTGDLTVIRPQRTAGNH